MTRKAFEDMVARTTMVAQQLYHETLAAVERGEHLTVEEPDGSRSKIVSDGNGGLTTIPLPP